MRTRSRSAATPKHRLLGAAGRVCLTVGAALSLGAGAAQAAPDPQGTDVIDWAPPDAEGALVLRHVDALKLGLQLIDARFGNTRALKGAVPRLLAFERGGTHPFAADWGPGIDLGRGVAFYAYTDPANPAPKGSNPSLRCVIASTDAAKARTTLAALLSTEAEPVTVRDDHLVSSKLDFACLQRGPWLVCDTGKVPETAPGRTPWLSTDAWLEVATRGKPMRELAAELPLVGFSLKAGPTLAGGQVSVRLDVDPAARPMLASLLPGNGPVGGADCIDQRSAFVGRLSVDAERLFKDHGASVDAGVPPEARPLWEALKSGFTGDLLFSGAGGLTHPLLTVGVRDAASAEAIVKGLAKLLQSAGAQLTASPGTLSIGIPGEGDQLAGQVHLRYGVKDRTLIFGLAERDVARCVNGEIRAAALPAGLAAKGANGFVTWALPSGGLPPGLITGTEETQILEDLSAVVGVLMRLVDELGVRVAPSAEAIDLEFWWTLL